MSIHAMYCIVLECFPHTFYKDPLAFLIFAAFTNLTFYFFDEAIRPLLSTTYRFLHENILLN